MTLPPETLHLGSSQANLDKCHSCTAAAHPKTDHTKTSALLREQSAFPEMLESGQVLPSIQLCFLFCFFPVQKSRNYMKKDTRENVEKKKLRPKKRARAPSYHLNWSDSSLPPGRGISTFHCFAMVSWPKKWRPRYLKISPVSFGSIWIKSISIIHLQ